MRFIVKKSPIEGVGLFSEQDDPVNTILFKASQILFVPH